MAAALQLRVERDARFASDVSHELRSPLTTLSASIEVLQARRDEMPERAVAALDLLVADVARFQSLVEDLLEISRFDAGAVRLVPRGPARRRVRAPGRQRVVGPRRAGEGRARRPSCSSSGPTSAAWPA